MISGLYNFYRVLTVRFFNGSWFGAPLVGHFSLAKHKVRTSHAEEKCKKLSVNRMRARAFHVSESSFSGHELKATECKECATNHPE